jgi:hypothetical protein
MRQLKLHLRALARILPLSMLEKDGIVTALKELPMPSLPTKLREILELFDVLPDDAIVPTSVTSILLGTSERTVRYHPHLPRVQVTRVRYGQRVGDIRKLVRQGMEEVA